MSNRGFLLIEVIVAVFILIFAMSTITFYVTSFSEYRKRNESNFVLMQNSKTSLLLKKDNLGNEVTSNIIEYVDNETGFRTLRYKK